MEKQSVVNLSVRLLKTVAPLAPVLVLSLFMSVAGALIAIFINVAGVDAVYRSAAGWKTAALLAVVCVFAAGRSILRYIEQLSGHYIAFRILAVLRDKVFRALRQTAPASLESKQKGEMVSVITSDIELLEVFFAHTIVPVLTAVIVTIVMTAFLWGYHPVIAMIALFAYLIAGVLLPAVNMRTGERDGDMLRVRTGRLSTYFYESIRGLPEILRFGASEKRMENISRLSEELSQKGYSLRAREGRTSGLTEGVITLFTGISLTAGLLLLQKQEMSFEAVLICTAAVMSSFGSVAALGGLSNNLLNTFASARRVFAVLDEKPPTLDVEIGCMPELLEVSADKVCFSYGGPTVLEGVSAIIKKNTIAGLSGKSGCGKSTFMKLLMRFWSVDSGVISIGDCNIENIRTEHLRTLEGYMTQDTFLFDDTIEENIRIAKRDALWDEIESAARKASVHEFIMSLPDGYKTRVGELGGRLSGGEKQRIGLARLFLCDVPLLLLDEPTSSLDALNEAVILKSVAQQCGNKTVILSSHRKSALRICDEIYTIQNKKLTNNAVAENGMA